MLNNRGKPEWVRPTPRDMYAKGVSDAATYIRFGRMELPELPGVDNFHKPKKQNHGWAAGMVARYYGVNLQPNGRD
jgi:hypothetical protein